MADMDLFDERIYRTLTIKGTSENGNGLFIVPGVTQMTYAGSYYESPAAAIQSGIDKIEELTDPNSDTNKEPFNSIRQSAEDRAKAIIKANKDNAQFYNAPLSFIHPYALLRLNSAQTTDASGNVITSGIIDKAGEQKWYEEDSTGLPDNSKNYAKNPTTADLISWSKSDPRGRFTYMFQDFVFCKYWNRIENNRMITLRRYPAPVVDAVEPADYNGADKLPEVVKDVGNNNTDNLPYPTGNVFAPLATAITYFGEGTGNSLKELLGFAYQYNWDEMETDVWGTTSSQIEEGNITNGPQWLAGGLSVLAQATGIIRDLQGVENIRSQHAVGLPPDPYSQGPYENRILGPVNVINNSYKRKRGLKFTHDSLTLTFEYMSRPIANVNNKAIMLDLLANILTMTYSSAIFFGGAHKYRTEYPAIYPWRNTNSLNKIYRGKLFGKEGAWYDVLGEVFNRENGNWILDLANGITNAVKAVASDLIAAVTGKTQSSEEKEQNENDKRRGKAIVNTVMGTAGRAVAAKFLKGKQAPWLQNARALLTGEPVGDWHLMIGNPLNPIAMIGNLIVTNSKIEFSDELGPDDFPIGFKAQITLQHAMGRDKDGIEAMFNRGAGRIYILPDDFVSSADGESTVDKYSGENNPFKDTFKANGEYGVLATTGSYYVKGSTTSLWSSKDRRTRTGTYTPTLSADAGNINGKNVFVINDFKTQAWQMHSTL